MSIKLLKIKYKKKFTLASSKVYLAKISTTLYVCIRGARETISYSTFSLDMLVMEMLLHTVTTESVLEIRDLHIRHI